MKRHTKHNTFLTGKQSNWIIPACIIITLIIAIIINVHAFLFITPPPAKPVAPAPQQAKPVAPAPQKVEPQSRFASITKEQRIQRLPILKYSDIQDIPQSNDADIIPKVKFEEQMKYLKDNGYTTITAQEFIDAYNGKVNLPKNSVMLTFDGGYQSMKTIVNPILKQYNLHAVSFIVGSFTSRPDTYLTADDIKTLKNDNVIEFESHTFDFYEDGKIKGMINETPAVDIVSDNKKNEEIIGHKTNFLCYPFGAYSNNAFEGLKAANIPFGFAVTTGVSNWVYVNEAHTTTKGEVQNPLALPRVRITPSMPIQAYADLITDN